MMAKGKLWLADPFAEALKAVALHANAADRGESTLAPDLALMQTCGLLAQLVRDCLPCGNALAGAELLRQIGRASLSVGRIAEGHANALLLIQLYGTSAQRRTALEAAEKHAIFGVWGADGKDPVTLGTRYPHTVSLCGAKRFCSGIGLVTRAVVPVHTRNGPQLVIVDVSDPSRGDVSGWQVSGMRATASGTYDLTGLEAEPLGDVNDYHVEPHFEGGIWRYCAVQCGGLEALAEQARHHIIARDLGTDAHQRARLAHLICHAHGARLWVEAACKSTASAHPSDTVPLVLLAREAVEQACHAGIRLTERIIGTAAFDTRSDVDRIRRDLAFFLRQANLDGKLDKAAQALLAPAAPDIGEAFR